MTVEELIQLLRHLSELAECAGNQDIQRELDALAESLVPFSDRVINATVRAEIRASFGNEDLKMRFGKAFGFLRVFQRSAEKIGRAKDVKALQGMVTSLERPPAARRGRATQPIKPSSDAAKF